MPIFHGSTDVSVSRSCLDVISLIYGFLRRWRICCRHAHLSWFNRHFCFSFLSECNLSDLWIPEAMEDLLSVMPIFHGSTDILCFSSCLDHCKPPDFWIPEAVEDLLSSCPFFMVYHSDTFCLSPSHHHLNPLSDRELKCLH
jgi:hypothetical protein